MKKVLATEKSTGSDWTIFPGSERRRLRIRIRPASDRSGNRSICRRGHRFPDEAVLKLYQGDLRGEGLSMANVVKTTVLLQNIGDFGAMNEVYATFLRAHARPSRI